MVGVCVQGQYLTRGSRLVDFIITIGDGKCAALSLTDNEVQCRPPRRRPNRLSDSTCPVVGTRSLKVDQSSHVLFSLRAYNLQDMPTQIGETVRNICPIGVRFNGQLLVFENLLILGAK